MAIRISTTRSTHQHYARNGEPFTVRAHSAAILQTGATRALQLQCVGFGETEGEAVAEAVRLYREGRAPKSGAYKLGAFPGLETRL